MRFMVRKRCCAKSYTMRAHNSIGIACSFQALSRRKVTGFRPAWQAIDKPRYFWRCAAADLHHAIHIQRFCFLRQRDGFTASGYGSRAAYSLPALRVLLHVQKNGPRRRPDKWLLVLVNQSTAGKNRCQRAPGRYEECHTQQRARATPADARHICRLWRCESRRECDSLRGHTHITVREDCGFVCRTRLASAGRECCC